jgi:DNA-directed RNA polymerase subunit RPC12/RpoP
MGLKCKNCGYEVGGGSEFIRTIDATTTFVKEQFLKIIDVYNPLKWFSRRPPISGATADFQNSYGKGCPNCGSQGKWIDLE